MTSQNIESLLCCCILECASEEIGILLSILHSKYGFQSEGIGDEDVTKILKRAEIILDWYGTKNGNYPYKLKIFL